MRKPLGIILSAACVTTACVGTRLASYPILISLVPLIATTVALAACGKIDKRYFPIVIYSVGLALLFQTTLLSNGLVGTDIHTEYYFANQIAVTGHWDYAYPHAYNSALGSVVWAGFASHFIGIDVIWFYKIGCPILFAGVPLLLYFIYRNQFGETRAFLAAFLLVAIPTWMTELIGLPRQMLAELTFVACLYLIIFSNLPMKKRLSLICLFAALTVLFHYSFSSIIIFFLILGAVATLILKQRWHFFKDPIIIHWQQTFPLKYFALVIGVVIAVIAGYYTNVCGQLPLKAVTSSYTYQIEKIETLFIKPPPPEPSKVNPVTGGDVIETEGFHGRDPQMRAALALDFNETTSAGKGFRIIQILVQALLIIGTIKILKDRRKYQPEFIGFMLAGIVLLVCCFALPGFSAILNASRFYQIALLFLAPAFILGGEWIFRKQAIVTGLLLAYFIFNSGLVFEMTKTDRVDTITTPYSIALSYNRVPSGGVYTESDIEMRDWIAKNIGTYTPVYTDFYGQLLLEEKLGYPLWQKDYFYLPDSVRSPKPPADCYIFLRSWDTEHQQVAFHTGIGLREARDYNKYEMNLNKRSIVKQIGDAILYGKEQ